jgi:S-DNA-T family DNA segregation ATPase FtsK/SpoIIIE
VILDSNGAEQLIGRGDMLIGTGSDLTRVQCAFVDTPEVERITEFISKQQSYPTAFLLPEVESEEEGNDLSKVDLAKRDVLFAEAAQIVVSMQQGSTSFLQRKFEIGFNRAGKIMDQLEVAGIVGPSRGAKPREVLITDMVHLDSILNSL